MKEKLNMEPYSIKKEYLQLRKEATICKFLGYKAWAKSKQAKKRVTWLGKGNYV